MPLIVLLLWKNYDKKAIKLLLRFGYICGIQISMDEDTIKRKISDNDNMNRKKNAEKVTEEDFDEEDKLMFETAKKNENSRKCGIYRQNKAFHED